MIIETLETPEPISTVYADPPWAYSNQATRNNTGMYDGTLSIAELCDLPIASMLADDAHLHLWTTNAHLFDARSVLEAWGFEYRSCFVWVKPQLGMGNYWRVSHEFMLYGRRGKAKFADRSLKSWGEYSRRKHSAKPEEVRHLIERACPGPYLELFARRDTPGWYVFGNQIETDLLA